MSYLEDTEKRILFSALDREKEICRKIDNEKVEDATCKMLVPVVESLERKFYYDRFEKEIRAKAIDEFAEKIALEISESIIGGMLFDNRDNSSYDTADKIVDYVIDNVKRIAEQLKGGAE